MINDPKTTHATKKESNMYECSTSLTMYIISVHPSKVIISKIFRIENRRLSKL